MNTPLGNGESYGLFAKNVSLVALANALLGLRGILLIPILSRQLGLDAYGLWTQVVIFVNLASSIASLGLNNAIARFLSGRHDRKELSEGSTRAFSWP